ncbi:MAG: hypothetical protein H0V53_09445 [Rubrobacter sp.]|nr:hypothetical protein [Rubrobacter sp.]
MRPTRMLMLLTVLALVLVGCAGEEEENGEAGPEEETPPQTTGETTQETAGEETAPAGAVEEATEAQEETTEVQEEETAGAVEGERDLGVREGSRMSALAGLEDATSAAEEQQGDAALYAMAGAAPPEVDAGGLSGGWLYSFISPSTSSIIQVSVTTSEVEVLPEQELVEGFAQDIAAAVLPNPEEIKDSPQAVEESPEIREALESEPELALSAGLDSASSEDPVWILQVVGAERLDDRIDALEP